MELLKRLKHRCDWLVVSLMLLGFSPTALAGLKDNVPQETGYMMPRDVSLDGHRVEWLINITMVFLVILFVLMIVWMAIAIFCMEVAVSVKYGQGEYAGKGEISKEVMTAWLASALFLIVWMLVYFRKVDALLPARFSDTQQLALDWLFISIPLPLLGLFFRELLRTFDDFGVSAALFGREVHTALLNRD